jgi:hypothetical protein
VGHAQKTPLKGQRFESLAAAQAYLDRWETNWADTRIHGTTKRQVAAMFAEERPHLLPLPLEPFRFYEYGQRVVNLDGCVEVAAAYYSAPPGWIGRRVPVQWDGLNVRLLHPQTGQLLREHLRQKRGWHRIQEEDRSPRTPPQPDNYWTGPRVPAPTSACSVRRSINDRDKWVCVAFWVCSPWPSALGQYALKQPAPKPSHSACGSITL